LFGLKTIPAIKNNVNIKPLRKNYYFDPLKEQQQQKQKKKFVHVKPNLHIRFPPAFTTLRCDFYNLPWFCPIKLSNNRNAMRKTHAETGCVNAP